MVVQYTGRGIKKSDIRKIFKKYKQILYGYNSLQNGTGLGLVICKEIVELHGGKIWVESIEGKGSNFLVSLPTVRCSE